MPGLSPAALFTAWTSIGNEPAGAALRLKRSTAAVRYVSARPLKAVLSAPKLVLLPIDMYSQPSGPKWTAFGEWFSRERGSPFTKSVRLAGSSKFGPISRVKMPESVLTLQVVGDWLNQKRG